MTIWSMLEIEPTGEIAIIKKAYAKKLKSNHPEDNPEGYQKLREAYDSAMKYARSGQQIKSAVPVVISEDKKGVEEAESSMVDRAVEVEMPTALSQETERALFHPHPIQQDVAPQEQPTEIFDRQIRELYSDFSRRMERASWDLLLNEDFMWNIENRDSIRDRLMLFLADHRHLPHAVWEVLDSFFSFREDKTIYLRRYRKSLVEYIIEQVDGSTKMGYECFLLQEPLDFDIENYLNLRQSAQSMLMKDNHDEAGQFLDAANQLFQNDPDLQLIRAKYCLDISDYKEALASLNRVITMWPSEIDGYLLRGRLLYHLQRYEEAISDCEFLMHEHADNKDVQCLLLECRIALSQFVAARTQSENLLIKKNEFDHFRYLSILDIFDNKKLYPQALRTSSFITIGKTRVWSILFYLLIFFKLSWLYISAYIVCYFSVSELHPLVTTVFILILLWIIRKISKTADLFSN